jgi:hypothetical protein
MRTHQYVRCVLCGHTVKPERLGLTETGAYDSAAAPAHTLEVRLDHLGGRAALRVEKLPLPLPFAYGMRDALKAALARVNAEIAEAGGDPDVDE